MHKTCQRDPRRHCAGAYDVPNERARSMFGWLRKNKPRQVPAEKTGQEITRIVGTYTALLEKHPLDIMDASWLPADKQKMTYIFRVLWLAASADNNDKMRRETEATGACCPIFSPVLVKCPSQLIFLRTIRLWGNGANVKSESSHLCRPLSQKRKYTSAKSSFFADSNDISRTSSLSDQCHVKAEREGIPLTSLLTARSTVESCGSYCHQNDSRCDHR